MAINIWKKNTILREYGIPTNTNGYATQTYADRVVKMDVQTLSDIVTNEATGDTAIQRIKTFGSFQVKTARDGKSDHIWFQGKWFECTASRLSNNTWIRHWTSEFCECINQDDPPDEGML